MAKVFILLTAFVAVPFTAFGDTENDRPPIGRYQIAFSMEGLYFLDTATGELWLKSGGGNWSRVDSPVDRRPNSKELASKPVSLALPKAGETMPMVQREKRPIPGSSGTLWVQLGDITGGQVFVEVSDHSGNHLVERTSLKNKEFLKFQVDQKDVYLQVVEMVNNLLDEDICKIHVSFKKPKPDPKAEESKDSKEP